MARIYYDKVPLIAQAKTNSCWYACAEMIGKFYEVGPRKGLPDHWTKNEGLDRHEMHKLAAVEGWTRVLKSQQTFTMASLVAALSARRGPLFAAGTFGEGPHAVVLRGATDEDGGGEFVYVHDPGWDATEATEREEDLSWFNKNLWWDCLYGRPS